MATTKRTRRRVIAETNTSKVTPEMKKLAAEYHRENTACNKAKSKAEKARKALYSQMKDAGLKTFDLPTNIDGNDVILESVLSTPPRNVISIEKLRSIVTEKQFNEIVTASAKGVTAVAGTDVTTRCTVSVDGTENVSVKAKK